jgi:hypothetical protein
VIDATPIDAALGPWGAPMAIPTAATAGIEDDATMSSDKLELIFGLIVGTGSAANKDLYVTTRPSLTGAWTTAVALTTLNGATTEESPRLSADDLTLYFGSHRSGAGDIYQSTRSVVGGAWSIPVAVGGNVNTAVAEKWLSPCAGGDYLMVQDHTAAGTSFDLVEGVLGGAAPTTVAELSSTANDSSAFLSADCLTTYFASGRDGGTSLYTAHRATVGGAWSTPTMVTDFQPAPKDNEQDPWISTDGRTFVYASDRVDIGGANTDVFIVTR